MRILLLIGFSCVGSLDFALAGPDLKILEEKIKAQQVRLQHEAEIRNFKAWVSELEREGRPLSEKEEAEFVRKAIDLKIYADPATAQSALSDLKTRIKNAGDRNGRTLGFNNKDYVPPAAGSDKPGMQQQIGIHNNDKAPSPTGEIVVERTIGIKAKPEEALQPTRGDVPVLRKIGITTAYEPPLVGAQEPGQPKNEIGFLDPTPGKGLPADGSNVNSPLKERTAIESTKAKISRALRNLRGTDVQKFEINEVEEKFLAESLLYLQERTLDVRKKVGFHEVLDEIRSANKNVDKRLWLILEVAAVQVLNVKTLLPGTCAGLF